jgi:hypothetical protein
MTLHSWGAIAPSVDDVGKLLSYIRTARPALLRWKRTQILIIDEGKPFLSCAAGSPIQVFFSLGLSVDGGWAFV